MQVIKDTGIKFCPCCNKPVHQVDYQFTGEFGEQHTFVYVCQTPRCNMADDGSMTKIWDKYGEHYGFPSIKQNSLVPSLARKLDVEIHKIDVLDKTMLHPYWCFGLLQPYIQYSYKADEYGNVLSKKWKLCFLKGRYKYTPFWETWSFLWWRYKNEGFQKSINRAWPYRSFEWFVKTFFST